MTDETADLRQASATPPTASIDCVTIDCADPERLAEFWGALLGYQRQPNFTASFRMGPPAGKTGPVLLFAHQNPGAKTTKNRLHLDLRPDERELFVAHAMALGATRVGWAADITGWTVLTDPEGNEFCVLQSAADYAAFVANMAQDEVEADGCALSRSPGRWPNTVRARSGRRDGEGCAG